MTEYVVNNQQWPESLTDLGYESDTIGGAGGKYEVRLYENGMVGAWVGADSKGKEQYVVLEPAVDDERISWTCYGQNIQVRWLPTECR